MREAEKLISVRQAAAACNVSHLVGACMDSALITP